MVSTRSRPTPLPSPSLTPSKALTTPRGTRPSRSTSRKWTHTPTPLTLLWLLVSLPLVIWDTGYVLLRPLTMPGGRLHKPLYTPYALYGTVDYIYGDVAWQERNGFTGAQGCLNVVETVGYLGYLWVVWRFGNGGQGRGLELGGRTLAGGWGGVACLVGFALSVMTVSKTVLYWANEAFSGFRHIGHNDPMSLILLWIIPNGAWLVLPSYMIYVFARDILHGLAIASGDSTSKPARAATPTKDD